MELILWRHAEAENGKGIPDAERKLTPAGEKQAHRIAQWLKTRLPPKTCIFVSPTQRARQTAAYLELPYEVERKIGIGSDTADLIAVANWPVNRNPVLLLGHQPAIGKLAAMFVAGGEAEMPVKKCGVLWFSTREREHRMQVVLRAVMYPDLVG